MVLGNSYDIKLGEWRADTYSLLSAQELWFAVFMTILYASLRPLSGYNHSLTLCSVLIPWLTVRKVPVEVEIVSYLARSLTHSRSNQD